MKRILLIATFLYLFIAPLTYHPDNKAVLFWASQANGTVWDIWKYGETNLKPDQQYNYPPLHFYLDKLQFAIAKPLGGPGFVEWLNSPQQGDLFQVNIARFMMATKLPLIIFGLAVGYLIYLLAKQFGMTEFRAKVAAAIWFFNPITLYSIPMMGQNDVMAIFFFLIGWLLLRKKPIIAAIVFGLAASVKTYPLIWLAFLLPATANMTWKQKVRVFLLSVVVYGLTMVPFLHDPIFRTVGMNSEINNRFLIAQIGIGFSQAIYIVPVLLAVAFFSPSVSPALMVLAANLVLLGFSHFHPQWYTWTVPFFALWIVSQEKAKVILKWIFLSIVTFVSWLGVVALFADKWLFAGVLGVANPALGNLPILRDFLTNRGVDVVMLDNLAHTALAAVAIVVLISLFTRDEELGEAFSIENFGGVTKRWQKISKPIRVLLLGILFGGVFSVWFLVLQAIPAPASTPPMLSPNYVVIDKVVQGSFVVDRNNFDRFDLFLSNPDLENIGKYQITLSDGQKIIHQQVISGINIGENSTVRFDLTDVQENSLGKTYSINIHPLEGTRSASSRSKVAVKDLQGNTGYILAGVTKANNPQALGVQQFFSPVKDFSGVVKNTLAQIKSVGRRLGVYYVGLFVLLCLWG